MPTYEYRCPEGHDFEKFFSRISEAAAELECPECGKIAERRISGGAGLLFKGSGFYLTDYGRNAHRGSAPSKKESGSKESGGKESGDKKSQKESKSGAGGEGSGSGGMKASEGGGSGSGGSAPEKSSGSSNPKSGGTGNTSQ